MLNDIMIFSINITLSYTYISDGFWSKFSYD